MSGAPPLAIVDGVAVDASPDLVAELPSEMEPPVPASVSLKQLLFALRDSGWITHAEALAAARTGALPATLAETLEDAVAAGTLPPSAADDAALTWAAMYVAERHSGLWALLIAASRATAAQVDDLFRAAVDY